MTAIQIAAAICLILNMQNLFKKIKFHTNIFFLKNFLIVFFFSMIKMNKERNKIIPFLEITKKKNYIVKCNSVKKVSQ